MSLFGGSLGGIVPDDRAQAAREKLREAEVAYQAAEDRLIKARREFEDANRVWRNFHFPSQQTRGA